MDLQSRLSRLQSQVGAENRDTEPKSQLSELRARIAELEKRGRARKQRHPTTAPALVAGAEPGAGSEHCGFGGEQIAPGLTRICTRYPLTGTLGSIELHSLREPPQLPGEPGLAHLRRVYLDTETTGLSGGSGTLAFLIGIAVVTETAIELTQFLITRFAGETAMLSALADSLGPNDQLVSYNGKSYDLPLLVTRFRMQARRHPFAGLAHLDLLHPTRRLFSKRWPDCRLITLEQNLLGFHRIDDLPGSEAPAAWFSYIRNGDDRQLKRVIEHNAQDILSLAVAHQVLAQAVAQPDAFGVDLYALGRWLVEQDETGARELLQSYRERLCDDATRLLARLYKRSGNWSQATALWEHLAAAGCVESVECLAKYHEHISKDFSAARRCCERLSNNAAHEHRRRRIEGKIAALRS